MEVVEEAQQAVLHLLDVGHVSQEGVLDDGRLSLVLVRFTGRTQVMPGFIPNPPGGESTVSRDHTEQPGFKRSVSTVRCAGGSYLLLLLFWLE